MAGKGIVWLMCTEVGVGVRCAPVTAFHPYEVLSSGAHFHSLCFYALVASD